MKQSSLIAILRRWNLLAAVSLLLLLLCLAGHGAPPGRQTLRVFIPCGTVGPVSQALELFREGNPQLEIRQVVDKGKPLAQRLRAGATCDVFIGRPEEMGPLLKAGLLDPAHHSPIAAQILCLATPTDNPAGLRSLQDLASPRLRTLALAPEQSHPGKYTRQALKRLGLTGKIKARVVVASDAEALPALLGQGEVQAAILFLSCVQIGVDGQGKPIAPKRISIIASLPATSHEPIMLSAATAAPSRQPQAARRLVEFLGSSQARQFFLRSGFRAPKAE